MKRILVALTVVGLAAGTALAAEPMGSGAGAACSGCMGSGMNAADTAPHKKFMRDTMSLRQEMMNKHFEMQKEYVKETPDAAVIAKLKGEIAKLRTKIMDARAKAGLPMGHKGHKMMKGGMDEGMMDCPMMTDPAPEPAVK